MTFDLSESITGLPKIPRTLRSLIFCLHKELLEDAAVAASLDEDEELSKVAMKAVTQLVKSALDINTSWYGKYGKYGY